MQFKNHKERYCASAEQFRGLTATPGPGKLSAALHLSNFIISDDGSLVTRDGFGHVATLPAAVRSFVPWQDNDGHEILLAAAGAAVYRIDLADGTATPLSTLEEGDRPICFFPYAGKLYFLDGLNIYHYFEGTVTVIKPYLPLYGKEWDPNSSSNLLNEPINLLTPYIRIHYRSSQSLYLIHFGFRVSEAVLYDGTTPVSPSLYTLSADGSYIRLTSSYRAQTGEYYVIARLNNNGWNDAGLFSCPYAAQYDSFTSPRFFFFGGDEASSIYLSQPIEEDPLSGDIPLYIPPSHRVSFGSGRAITDIARVWDRMMICTVGDTWLTDAIDDSRLISVRPLSSSTGCVAPKGLVMLDGNSPVTLSPGGVFQWNIDPSTEWSAERRCLSFDIEPRLGQALSEARLYYTDTDRRLWVFLPDEAGGKLFVYRLKDGTWTTFAGVSAKWIYEISDKVGFCDGHSFYLFDPTLGSDQPAPGETRHIEARFVGRHDDFGNSETVKRGTRLTLEGELSEGGELVVQLSEGDALLASLPVPDHSAEAFDAHLATPRFHRAALTLTASGPGRKRIFRVGVHAR